MSQIKDRWTSATDRGKWAARGSSFTAKLKATKAVWFPPEPVKTGEKAASAAKNGAKKTSKKTGSKTGGAAKKTARAGKKTTGTATKKAVDRPRRRKATSA